MTYFFQIVYGTIIYIYKALMRSSSDLKLSIKHTEVNNLAIIGQKCCSVTKENCNVNVI